METLKEKMFSVSEAEFDAADAEINKRLEAGEDLLFLYASYSNEVLHCVEINASCERIQKLKTMLFCLSLRVADVYLVGEGWELNDKHRFVLAND